MFCSLCLSSEKFRNTKRKICPIGHVACEKCDKNLSNCLECGEKIVNFLCVEVKGDVPRMFITEDPEKNVEPPNAKPGELNLLEESKSFQDMLKEIEEREGEPLRKPRPRCSSVLGCFEIVEPQPSPSPFMFDDERELLKNFEICHSKSFAEVRTPLHGRPEPRDRSATKLGRKSSAVLSNKKEVRAEIVNHAVRDVSTSPIVLADSMKGNYSQAGDRSSRGSYLQSASIVSEQSRSVTEFYRNHASFDDSDTAHFTPLTVSSSESTPRNSPPQETVPSTGHRVKFVASVNFDRVAPQNEPLITFEPESSDSNTSVSSRRISRFPVCCPITTCEANTMPSDFCNHITIDHPYIPYLKVAPAKTMNTTLNHKGNPNMVTCQRMLLLTGKVNEIGYGAFENCLPILLMTCKMSMQKAFDCSSAASAQNEQLFVFLAGVYEFPVSYTITFWTHGRDNTEPVFIKCMSSSVESISKPISLKEIAMHSISLSPMELQKLSGDGQKPLSCQIIFH